MRPRLGTRLVLGVALLAMAAAALFGYVAGSAPAGNRNPTATLQDFPGPHQITFGKNVAYSATLTDTGSSNFTHVTFSMTRPSTQVNGSTVYANLLYASCDTDGTFEGLTATSYSCPEIAQINSGATAKIVLVWQTQSAPAGASCAPPTTTCQLTTTSKWIIKEGTGHPGSAGPDTFPAGPVVTGLLLQPDPGQAGGYPIAPCTSTSNPSLATNQALGTTNPMSTAVCAPVVPQGDVLNPGLVVTINERPGHTNENGFTDVSEICIPDTGQTCPETTPFHFPSDKLATFVFVYDNNAFKPLKITKMYDNNVQVSSDPTQDPYCNTPVVDNNNKITTVTCHSSTNGPWRGG